MTSPMAFRALIGGLVCSQSPRVPAAVVHGVPVTWLQGMMHGSSFQEQLTKTLSYIGQKPSFDTIGSVEWMGGRTVRLLASGSSSDEKALTATSDRDYRMTKTANPCVPFPLFVSQLMAEDAPFNVKSGGSMRISAVPSTFTSAAMFSEFFAMLGRDFSLSQILTWNKVPLDQFMKKDKSDWTIQDAYPTAPPQLLCLTTAELDVLVRRATILTLDLGQVVVLKGLRKGDDDLSSYHHKGLEQLAERIANQFQLPGLTMTAEYWTRPSGWQRDPNDGLRSMSLFSWDHPIEFALRGPL